MKRKSVISILVAVAIVLAPNSAFAVQGNQEKPVTGELEIILPEDNFEPEVEIVEFDDEEEIEIFADITNRKTVNDYTSKVYDYEWDKYASNYVYNNLSDEQKALWNAFRTQCDNALYSPEEYENGRLGFIKVPKEMLDNSFKMGMQFMTLFKYSNPQYFFLVNGITGGTRGSDYVMSLRVYDNMATVEGMTEAKELFFNGVNSFIDLVDAEDLSDDEAIAKALQKVICEQVEYNHESVDNKHINEQNEYTQTAYSTFVLKNTVCSGYAQGLSILACYYGLDCMGVTSPGHAYNKIKVFDSWYNIDTTWADQSYGIYYDYYLKSDYTYNHTDDPGDNRSHTTDPEWVGLTPPCTQDSSANGWTYGGVTAPDLENRTSDPVISVNDVEGRLMAEISADSEAVIYYTLDGVDPSDSYSRSLRYSEPFEVTEGQVIKAIAFEDTKRSSNVVEYNVVLGDPVVELSYAYLSIAGTISIVLDCKIPNRVINDGEGYVDVSGEKLIKFSDLKECTETYNGEEYYVVKIGSSAKDMDKQYVIKFYNSKDELIELVNLSGESYENSEMSCSIDDYIDKAIAQGDDEKLKYLGSAMRNYGDYAKQYFFGTEVDDSLHSDDVKNSMSLVAAEQSMKSRVNCEIPGLVYEGTSMVLESSPKIRHYFNVEENYSFDDFTFTYGSDTLEKHEKDNMFYVELTDVYASALESFLVVGVSDYEGNYGTIEYSADSYLYSVLDKDDDSNLVSLCKSLHVFGDAVKNMF